MAIGAVVTRGYSIGSVNLVVTRGYVSGAAVVVDPNPVKRQVLINRKGRQRVLTRRRRS